ncbi:MAG: Exodeoxyribonuclease 7 large subunit [Tenericutes bacterium ADurb.BinA155]|nr:MAG: Exodeoxyribonuclease 7 large subunit [Tenericutes bacterium ADurb.BinA155]
MVVNLQKRWPLVDILVFPSLVQGKDAPKNLIEAFKRAESYPLDTLIIGRGGGSSEDLSAFNDEGLVRALATSKCPTISAVGHEVDTTLTDYVCDVRVSTPTGAAVAAVPDQNQILESLDTAEASMTAALKGQYQAMLERFNALKKRGFFANPALIYQQKISDLELLKQRFYGDIDAAMKERSQDVSSLKDHLKALSPYGILGRGYAITMNAQGEILNSIDKVGVGETIKTQLKDGIIEAKVASKEKIHG